MKIEIKLGSIEHLLDIEQQIPEFSQPRQREQILLKLKDSQQDHKIHFYKAL